ncbi:hypothetical protein AaE_016166 [Aphanomyces astaci]|uniref:Transposase IS30-like HTH domain-containing protein n=1 Tax=Aphanomyces astaci TaxID=112090 RepID=A0A6A4YZI2_APHAT|nr:hypothetical protein AaE_016166 [Aphanomyces astaci]
MKTRQKVTDEERSRIRGLREAGLTFREICVRTNRPLSVVSRCLRPRRQPKPRGRPLQLSDRHRRQLLRAVTTGASSAVQIRADLNLPCSKRTAQREVQRCDFLEYSMMEKTLDLTPQHKAARFDWVMARCRIEEWKYVVFSDEKKFNLDGPDGFKQYWRDIRQPAKQVVTRQQGGGSAMVWGCIA